MNRFLSRCTSALSGYCFAFFFAINSAPVVAEQDAGLTLAQAIAVTIAKNPELQSSMFSMRSAAARITQAGYSPSPEVALQIENFAGSGDFSNANSAETTLMLSQVLELGDKRGSRIEATRANYSMLSVEAEARRLDILAEVARRFIHVASDQQAIKLAQQATVLAEQTLRAVDTRVRAAKSPAVETHRAQIALTRARIDEEHAEHELLSSRRKLAALWGDGEPDFDAVAADLFRLPTPIDFDVLVTRLKTNADFTRFAHEQRLRDAELRLAETRGTPNMQIGAGVRQLQASDDHAFVISASMPLFTHSRNSGAMAEATARQAQVSVDERAAFLRAQAQLFEVYQELLHSITEANALREHVLPQTENILQQTEYAYQRGRYSYIDWIAAQRELLDAQRRLIDASAEAHRYAIEIERLTGESLIAPAGVQRN